MINILINLYLAHNLLEHWTYLVVLHIMVYMICPNTQVSGIQFTCFCLSVFMNTDLCKQFFTMTSARTCWNYALEAIINCIIIIPGSLLMFIRLCYNCNGLCGGLPSSMLIASGGKPICRCGV